MKITKYSKKYTSYLTKLKASFETENKELLLKQTKDAKSYSQEPIRNRCKNCQIDLNTDKVFFKKKFAEDVFIDFILCETCGHLNGKHQDTEEYSKKLYSDITSNYGKTTYLKSTISEDDYNERVENIYLPKVQFFNEVTQLDPNNTKIFDMGCGAGYLIKSFQRLGFNNIIGSEISPDLLAAAEKQIKSTHLIKSSDNNVLEILNKFDGNVVCMIGVLEHLVYNDKVMESIINNKHIEYIYISVPKLSVSVFLELLSTEYFHRHLSSGHTHLYTESSLKYFENMYSLERLGEWYFGADVEDLRRLIFSKLDEFEEAKEYLEENFFSNRDSLQNSIDKTRFTSEIHLVFKINR